MVVDASFLVVVSFFAPASFFVVAVEVVESDVVVIDSFLLAHEVIKPAAASTATEVISDFFIGVVNERPECSTVQETASIN